jgi:branched-chain amino acid transport system ATP-binding protein
MNKPDTAILKVRNLNTYYGAAHILHGIDLDLAHGETIVLIGRNGAGKSTTLKSIMGLLRPAAGNVEFDGQKIDGLAPYQIARKGLGYVPEERRVFATLSVAENLEVGRYERLGGGAEWTPERLYDLFPNLAEMRNRPANQMSGGEQQMLAISRTLMGNPSVLLLDEPSEGLAPVVVETMAKALRTLVETGLSILLCEQNLNFAAAMCNRAYVIETGQIRHQGAMEELLEREDLRQAYLAV